MAWLAFAIVVLGAICSAINYRGFRRVLMFTLLGIAVLAAAGEIVANFYNQLEEFGPLGRPFEVMTYSAGEWYNEIRRGSWRYRLAPRATPLDGICGNNSERTGGSRL